MNEEHSGCVWKRKKSSNIIHVDEGSKKKKRERKQTSTTSQPTVTAVVMQFSLNYFSFRHENVFAQMRRRNKLNDARLEKKIRENLQK